MAEKTEYGIRPPAHADGMRLAAFVARPIPDDRWGYLHDTLNPQVTRRFIELTHERYRRAVGAMFGRQIKAIFLDEPKFFSSTPWTPGMLESFRAQYGYDLGPRLRHLFSDSLDDEACRTRLEFRQWCARRFEEAWLRPVGDWCRRHRLHLVGHISPEEEPISQVDCVGNLFPLFRHFALCGIDLIIPAVGDRRHPMLNIGIVSAVSAAAQLNKPGVMSETLACSGLDFTAKQASRILHWQTAMGVTSPVVHYAQTSTKGMRLYDAPPDFGPASARWPGMQRVARRLAPIQAILEGARQVAPVAILWPIRSFQAQKIDWQNDTTGLRRDFNELLRLCLDRQVGTHILDEAALWEAALESGAIRLGRASYTHILIPSCTVLHTRTVQKLKVLLKAGVNVALAGRGPTRQQGEDGLAPLDMDWCPKADASGIVAQLPRLIEIASDAADIRCTAWEKSGRITRLLINLRPTTILIKAARRTLRLAPGKVRVL
jgi:hypothetical protein